MNIFLVESISEGLNLCVTRLTKAINCSSFADNKKSQASVSGKRFLVFVLFSFLPPPSFLNRTA